MNITDATYYQSGLKFIPNVNNLNTEIEGVPNSGNELDTFILKYERQLLIAFLGVSLYNELKTALQDLPNADVKWQNLVNGVEYTKDGVLYRFDGLRGYEKDSLVAYYVFVNYMQNDFQYYSTTGTIKSKPKGAVQVNSTRKYVNAYREFINQYQNDVKLNCPEYYVSNGVVVGVDYYNHSQVTNTVVTLQQYLEDNKTDFEGYSFKRYDYQNTLSI